MANPEPADFKTDIALLPQSNLIYSFPLKTSSNWRTLSTPSEMGNKQIVQRHSDPLRAWGLQFTGLIEAEKNDLWNFYQAHFGGGKLFLFKDPRDFTTLLVREDIGTGDGSATVFQLRRNYAYADGWGVTPDRYEDKGWVDNYTIYVNSVAQTKTTHYTIADKTGIITFVTAPPNTQAVEATFDWYYRVHFLEDSLNIEESSYLIWDSEAAIEEVRGFTPT